MMINSYRQEQIETAQLVSEHLMSLTDLQKEHQIRMIADYVRFRNDVHDFLTANFQTICTEKCYRDSLSACCSRDGVIIFFADVLISMLSSDEDDIRSLISHLQKPNSGNKCIYLSKRGCLWKMKPIVCEMFLCDHAEKQVFENNACLKQTWEALKLQEKRFTWPDQPVLFDELEEMCLQQGISSPLMYCHFSPGLLRIKQRRRDICTHKNKSL